MHYFFLGDDTFKLMPWMEKPHSRRQLTREERIANYRICRLRRVAENDFWNISKQVQGTTGHHGAKAKGCQGHCFYNCDVAWVEQTGHQPQQMMQ